MSVTFTVTAEPKIVRGCCDSCGGSGWDYNAEKPEGPFDPIPAGSECWECRGSGVVDERVYPVEEINLSNHNAALALEALGLSVEEWGEVPAIEVRKLVNWGMIGIGATDHLAEAPYALEGGHAGVQIVEQDGILTVQRMGARVISGGISAEGIRYRAGRILGMFEAAARLGCGVRWG